MADETLLVLSGQGVPPTSARGITQTLEPVVESAQLERAADGTLIDFSPTQFRKYHSVITCTDFNPPAFGSLWPGMLLTVDCVEELGYKTVGGTQDRPAVTGSVRVKDDWTYYRPQLQMRVLTPWRQVRNEWQGTTEWQLELAES